VGGPSQGLDAVFGPGKDRDFALAQGVVRHGIEVHRLDQQRPVVSIAGVGHVARRGQFALA
jgi:hypothetical protein